MINDAQFLQNYFLKKLGLLILVHEVLVATLGIAN